MTNMERIKLMNADTLSDFLQNESMCVHCNHGIKDKYDYINCELKDEEMDCHGGCLDWLKSESK